jgi:hypothetical protein
MTKLASNRVVDDHASQLANGHRPPELIGITRIWPIVEVSGESGKFMEFGADASVIRTGLERALGDNRERVDMRVSTGTYNTTEVSVEVPTFDRELKNVPEKLQAKYQEKKDELAQTIHLLGMEYAVSVKLRDPAEYDASMTVALTSTAQWKDAASNPFANLRAWLRTLSKKLLVPVKDLSIAMAAKPWEALQDHALTEKKLTAAGGELTLERLANWLGCKEVVLLAGQYASTFNPDDSTDVQGTDFFDDEVIVFREFKEGTVVDPLWGAICRVEGHPIVTRYRDEPKSADIVANDENYGILKRSNKRGFMARTVSGLT